MKTVYCLLSLSAFSFFLGNAQHHEPNFESKLNYQITAFKTICQTTKPLDDVFESVPQRYLDSQLVKDHKFEYHTVRTKSDIRVYLTRIKLKRVSNINLLFPEINSPVIS